VSHSASLKKQKEQNLFHVNDVDIQPPQASVVSAAPVMQLPQGTSNF
jgi:hypothetical protein